jgi:predicted transport protein
MTFQAYLDTIKAKTGMDPEDFQTIAAEKGLLVGDIKAGPIQKWLKDDYGLGAGHSMALVSVFRARLLAQPTKEQAMDKFFAGPKAVWRLTWDELMAKIMRFGSDIALQPTDTYIGIVRAGKKFAVVATTAARMDVGLKLKGEPVTDRLMASGSWNAMCSHRVQLFDGAELDDELLGWLREAYDRVG